MGEEKSRRRAMDDDTKTMKQLGLKDDCEVEAKGKLPLGSTTTSRDGSIEDEQRGIPAASAAGGTALRPPTPNPYSVP